MKVETVFYVLGSLAAVLFIAGMVQDSNEPKQPERNVVVVPGYFRNFGFPWWRRFRRNLPWVGPRPGRRRRRHPGPWYY